VVVSVVFAGRRQRQDEQVGFYDRRAATFGVTCCRYLRRPSSERSISLAAAKLSTS
jgi:hypothetical protein